MDSKLLLSKLFIENFKEVYENFCSETGYDVPFEKVFEDNVSRLEFLNLVLECVSNGKMSSSFVGVFSGCIEFMNDYINGNFECGLDVPTRYREDEQGLYIPTASELIFLFRMVNTCCMFHEKVYNGKVLMLDMPNETFNQNMKRCLTVNRENLAHILGFSEHEDKGNYLFKYFLELDKKKNPELYTTDVGKPLSNGERVSERYLNWILSEEGQNEIIHINEMFREIMENDMKKHPHDYVDGQPKSKDKFALLVKKELGIDFPMIKFSRYVCKTVNLFNFLNMNNTTEMIVDYNPQVGENIPFDFFLVNASNEGLDKGGQFYHDIKSFILSCVELLSSDNPHKSRIGRDTLLDFGIKIDFNSPDSVGSLSNLMRTELFVGKQGINPDMSGTNQSIMANIASIFANDIHLLGFGNKKPSRITGVDEKDISLMYCGSSMTTTIPEYLDKFNVRGRCFYIDTLVEGDRPGFVNSVEDEVRHLKRKELLGFENSARVEQLVELRNKFNMGFAELKQRGLLVTDSDKFKKRDEDFLTLEQLNEFMNIFVLAIGNKNYGDGSNTNKKNLK